MEEKSRDEVRKAGSESKSEFVIFLVRADPEPEIIAVALASDGAIAATDFGGVNSAFLLKA